MRLFALAALIVILGGCDGGRLSLDADGDGYPIGADCDDDDAAIHPAAEERCDGVDDNCSGDEADAVDTFPRYPDMDGDGFGDPTSGLDACAHPEAYVEDATDCDDTDPTVFPGALEVCDGADNDCDARTDGDDDDVTGEVAWYPDGDGDGYGVDAGSVLACDAPDGFVAAAGDCNDADRGISPGATEYCDSRDLDDNCDGEADGADAVNLSEWYLDADGDGWGTVDAAQMACDAPADHVAKDGDCDDGDAAISPDGDEVCGGADEDCDGTVDEDDAIGAPLWNVDADGDGYGAAGSTDPACTLPAGHAANADDCDDIAAGTHPGANETCDGADEDCDGAVDEGAIDAGIWFRDDDADGYGDVDVQVIDCVAPATYIADYGDCDDSDAAVNPSATEVCNGVDDDCVDGADGDDALGVATWYLDADGDSHGIADTTDVACDEPAGFAADTADCDDTRADVSPDGVEVCDADDTDEDCDGAADDADDDPTGRVTWHVDADTDGYGDSTDAGRLLCDTVDGRVRTQDDCDDAAADVHPGAAEVCNGLDDDCDGLSDPSTAGDAATWYADADADTYGDPTVSERACTVPAGFVADASDCDDVAAARYPGAAEWCDGADDDCDGVTDEDDALDAAAWFADADADGWGDAAVSTVTCSAPAGYVADASDCDDTDAAVSPSAAEVCDAADVDEDCDRLADDADPGVGGQATVYPDADGDGYGAAASITCEAAATDARVGGDCDDTAAAVSPAAAEVCGNGIDDDCDASTDSCRLAGDGSLADADLTLHGNAVNDYLGSAVAGDDLNDDGYGDLLVSGYGYDASTSKLNAGRTWVWYGPLGPGTGAAEASFTGVSGGEHVGWSIATLDSDGDGRREVLLGADGYDDGATTEAGAAYLFEGAPDFSGDTSSSAAAASFIGGAASDGFGWDVAAGDLDGDGNDDALVSACARDTGGTSAGAVAVFYGPLSGTGNTYASADAIIDGAAASDYAGYEVDAADLDGDGGADVIFGAYGADDGGSAAGAVYVFTSLSSGSQSAATADTILHGGAAGDELGHALATVGDTNGDGLDDLVVGAQRCDLGALTAGAAWLVLGSSSGIASGTITSVDAAQVLGGVAGERAGEGMAGGGDLDGDGWNDLLVGATYADDGVTAHLGATYLLYGPIAGSYDLTNADASWIGPNADAFAGDQLAILGDADGDLVDDFVTGVGDVDFGISTSIGAAYVFFGRGE